jgi:hypothetical protein
MQQMPRPWLLVWVLSLLSRLDYYTPWFSAWNMSMHMPAM